MILAYLKVFAGTKYKKVPFFWSSAGLIKGVKVNQSKATVSGGLPWALHAWMSQAVLGFLEYLMYPRLCYGFWDLESACPIGVHELYTTGDVPSKTQLSDL